MNIFYAYIISYWDSYENMLCFFLIEILIELIVDSDTVVKYRDSVNPLSSLPQC